MDRSATGHTPDSSPPRAQLNPSARTSRTPLDPLEGLSKWRPTAFVQHVPEIRGGRGQEPDSEAPEYPEETLKTLRSRNESPSRMLQCCSQFRPTPAQGPRTGPVPEGPSFITSKRGPPLLTALLREELDATLLALIDLSRVGPKGLGTRLDSNTQRTRTRRTSGGEDTE